MSWMEYVRAYKAAHPDEAINYKTLMQQYITGVCTECQLVREHKLSCSHRK